jgi:hypothetical protein
MASRPLGGLSWDDHHGEHSKQAEDQAVDLALDDASMMVVDTEGWPAWAASG